MQRHYHSIDDMPRTLGLFPLTGVLLLPRGHLPLNVFEPRYLALVESALSGSRLIGMIQPTENEEKTLKPALSAIGCAGRVTSYRETEDGRYLITLTGICRFRVIEELDTPASFRAVKPDFGPFAGDLAERDDVDFPRERLMAALDEYLTRRELKADWKSVMNAPAETLVNALAMLCPFEPNEKQALLEAPQWTDRVSTLLALLEMAVPPTGSSTVN